MADRTDAQILSEIANDKGIVQTSFVKAQLEVQLDIRRHHQEQVDLQKQILEVNQKMLEVIEKGKK